MNCNAGPGRRLIAACAALIVLTCAAAVLDASAGAAVHAPAGERAGGGALPPHRAEPLELEMGAPVERELAGGETHAYVLTAREGQFFQLVVEQAGIDVVVTLTDPGGRQVANVDRPNGWRGREVVSHLAAQTGSYGVRVRAWEKVIAQAKYRIELRARREAESRDESRVTAESAVSEGERLRARGTEESSRRAIEKFEQARALWRALSEPYEEAVAHYGIGWAYASLGENQSAVGHFTRSLSLMQELGDQYGAAISQNGLGWAYLYLGEAERAFDNFSRGLAIHRVVGNQRGEAAALNGLGWTYVTLNKDREGLDAFNGSRALRQATKDRRGEALSLVGIGKIHTRLGEAEKALDALNRALELLRSLGDRSGEVDVLSHLGWVHLSQNRNQEALDHFRQALPLRRQAGDRVGAATTLYGIGRSTRRLGNLREASLRIAEALDIIETLRTKGTSQQLRMSYHASVQEYYDTYVDLLMQLHRINPAGGHDAEAFHASERARARGLLDTLIEASVDIREGVDPELLERERSLQQQLNAAAERQRQLFSGKHTPAQAEAAARTLSELTAQYQECAAEIRKSSPRYAALTQPSPLTSEQVQTEVLDDDTLLLEYALGEERSYLWLVSREGLSSHELPAGGEVEAQARRVYELLTARNKTPRDETPGRKRARVAAADAEYWEAAARLSETLLGPVAERLGNKRLLIVPQRSLQHIPFGALPLPARGARARTPLLTRHEVAYLPSASTISVIRREVSGRPKARREVAVLADPVFTADDERFEAARRDAARSAAAAATADGEVWRDVLDAVRSVEEDDASTRLPRLFSTRWEAKEITSLVPPGEKLLALDFEANRGLATDGKLGDYRVLHFATHAFINNVHPELSGIVLSMVDQQGRPQDGFLRAHEIFNLNLRADLVVLSACRTGLGKEVRGEGLISLTRSFMYAGAPRVTVSLWAIEDKDAAELMVRFYRNMLGPRRLRPSAALREAQLELWKRSRSQHPYFWGAFVQQGEWR
jgi:CHAT domain-containing protein